MAHNLNDDADLDLIERYHRRLLTGIELDDFLIRQRSDKDFAQKVRSYTEIFEGIAYYGRQQAFAETILDWEKEIKAGPQRSDSERPATGALKPEARVVPLNRRTILWLSAAACVAFIIAFLVFLQNETPQTLASDYINTDLTTLSTTMDGETDSLTLGVGAFNDQDYARAEGIFRSLADNHELAPEVAEYLGITYLKSGKYDEAIAQFRKLISFTQLHVNPGKFYLAVALMKRSEQGDAEEAKKLLEEVVAKKLPGHEEATGWLKHF